MKLCISFGKVELKYFIYCFLFIILQLYLFYFIYYEKEEEEEEKEKEENIVNEHCLMHSFCFFLGYLLNIIPVWISHIYSKEKEKKPLANESDEASNHSIEYIYNNPNEKYLSTKDILIFLFICLILLITDLAENIAIKIDNKIIEENKINKEYNDDYLLLEVLIIFSVNKIGKEVYYKHQNISFLILIFIGAIKYIYFYSNNPKFSYISIILNIIYSVLYAIYYLFIKRLMRNKFITPYKCNYIIGIINVPLIILIYLIISVTPFGNTNNSYYYDNIFDAFKKFGNLDAKNWIILITLPFIYGIYQFIVTKTIYDYTIYHMYLPFLIQYFIENIIYNFGTVGNIILISSFLIELIMLLIFIEIIEINFCGFNQNLKKNIELRALTESSLAIENDDDDEIVDE